MNYKIIDNEKVKQFASDNYNYFFNKKTGFFARWGETKEDDPVMAPSPEILDIEISSGLCNSSCPWCYKGNGTATEIRYMSFAKYRKLLSRFKILPTQIAFGITYIDANPDFWNIVKYTRDKGVIPNYTTNGIGITEEQIKNTVEYCGAVAVSVYPHTRDVAYSAVKKFTDAGLKQTNIHFMLSEETYDFAFDVMNDVLTHSDLKHLNAIVFLQYKDKNKKSPFHTISNLDKFKKIVDFCLEHKINFGFDSCSSSVFTKSVLGHPNEKEMIQAVDNCESFGLFSGYINVDGFYFPCSFAEGIGEWKDGINVLAIKDFSEEVWHSELLEKYRQLSLHSTDRCRCKYSKNCRVCLIYENMGRCS